MKTVDVILNGECDVCAQPLQFAIKLNVYGERKTFAEQMRAVGGRAFDTAKDESNFYCQLHTPLEMRKSEAEGKRP